MQFIGCDVSKNTLDLAWFNASQGDDRKVSNDLSGWKELEQWAQDQCETEHSQICVVMEATCVYHKPVADYLHAEGFKVMVCNPGRSAEYARSQNQLNKNDHLDSGSLQRYGSRLEKFHWYQPDSPEIKELKSLQLLLRQLDKDIQRWRNRLEKLCFERPGANTIRSIKRQIRNLSNEQSRTQTAIDQLIKNTHGLKHDRDLMQSIKGVGPKTSQHLLPLLYDGRFNSARELAAFIGLTPRHKSSGTSVKSPGQLSGRGNKYLRSKLYMPAMSAANHNKELKTFYNTLLARGKKPKQANVALMRKLVHLCYGVVKNQTPYIENYGALS